MTNEKNTNRNQGGYPAPQARKPQSPPTCPHCQTTSWEVSDGWGYGAQDINRCGICQEIVRDEGDQAPTGELAGMKAGIAKEADENARRHELAKLREIAEAATANDPALAGELAAAKEADAMQDPIHRHVRFTTKELAPTWRLLTEIGNDFEDLLDWTTDPTSRQRLRELGELAEYAADQLCNYLRDGDDISAETKMWYETIGALASIADEALLITLKDTCRYDRHRPVLWAETAAELADAFRTELEKR